MKIEIGEMNTRDVDDTAEATVAVSVDGMTGEFLLRLADDGSGYAQWGEPGDWLRGDLWEHFSALDPNMPRIRRLAVLEGVARSAGALATEDELHRRSTLAAEIQAAQPVRTSSRTRY